MNWFGCFGLLILLCLNLFNWFGSGLLDLLFGLVYGVLNFVGLFDLIVLFI